MKQIFLFLTLFIMLSCTSTNNKKPESVDFRIWEIKTFTQEDNQYIPSIIKVGYLIHNIKTNQSFIHFILSEKTTVELESLWKKNSKKLKIEQINLIQEIKYNQEGSNLKVKSIKTDFVIKGENTEVIIDKINNILNSERAGESSGLFTLLYRIWNPDIIQQIPFPKIKKNDVYKLDFADDLLTVTDNRSSTIILKDAGIHEWIGY